MYRLTWSTTNVVSLTHGLDLAHDPGDLSSPLFSAFPESTPISWIALDRTAFFFCISRPLRYANIVHAISLKLDGNLLLSLGAYSIVAFFDRSLTEDTVEKYKQTLQEHLGENLFALERITIIDNKFNDARMLITRSVTGSFQGIDSTTFNSIVTALPEFQGVLQEVHHLLQDSASKAEAWAPPFVPVISDAREYIGELMKELVLVIARLGQTFPTNFSAQIACNELKSKIVRECAFLSYLVSQGLSCTPPLRSSECYFRRHSLLGVSQVLQSLSCLEKNINELFSQTPFDKLIATDYSRRAIPDGFGFKRSDQYETGYPVASRPSAFPIEHIERRLKELCQGEIVSDRHIIYISTRHGYKLSEKSMTVPAEVLHNSACRPWNLLTLTHELLHSHVLGILGEILGKPEGVLDEDVPEEGYLIYHITWFARLQNSGKNPTTIRELLIFRCLEFIENHSSFASGRRREQITGDTAVISIQEFTNEREARKRLNNSFKMLNEIPVHILDLQYFYKEQAAEYLQLIWLSWSRVPHVVLSLQDYLIRSMVAISTLQTSGMEGKRFEWSLQYLQTALNDLDSDPEAKRTLEAINYYIRNEENLRDLKTIFFYSLPFADDIIKYLYSPELHLKIQSHGIDLREGAPLSPPQYNAIPRGPMRASPLELAKHFYTSHSNLPREHWPVASSMLILIMSSCETERESHAS